jgi:hypothetical protein
VAVRRILLLKTGRYSDEIGRRLAGAAAELSQLAGWLAYDCELHGLGQRYLLQALSLAQSAGDSALCGEIMAAISHQSVYLAQSGTAIDLARTGQVAAQRAGLPTLLTECYVMEAHGHAARDDARACAGALVRAEKTFDQASRLNVPAWLSYFDAAYLAAKFGQCFRDLGQGEKAEQYARRSLDMDGRYVRGKAFNQTLLAVAHVQQKHVDQACSEGRAAVDHVAISLRTGLLATWKTCGGVWSRTPVPRSYGSSTSTPRCGFLRCCQQQGVLDPDDCRRSDDLTLSDHLLRFREGDPAD